MNDIKVITNLAPGRFDVAVSKGMPRKATSRSPLALVYSGQITHYDWIKGWHFRVCQSYILLCRKCSKSKFHPLSVARGPAPSSIKFFWLYFTWWKLCDQNNGLRPGVGFWFWTLSAHWNTLVTFTCDDIYCSCNFEVPKPLFLLSIFYNYIEFQAQECLKWKLFLSVILRDFFTLKNCIIENNLGMTE